MQTNDCMGAAIVDVVVSQTSAVVSCETLHHFQTITTKVCVYIV